MGNEITIKLNNKKEVKYPKGTTANEIVNSDFKKIAKKVIAANVNDTAVDLNYTINEDAEFDIILPDSEQGLNILRHSAAHVMAEAVLRLFPDAKCTIGPSIKDGFYYDFDVEKPFIPEDIEKIEKEIQKIIKENQAFERKEISLQEAKELYKKEDNKYKLEILDEIEDSTVSIYTQGNFTDLCRGPHIPSTGHLKAVKLLSVAGAYWRGDSDRESLSRIYGTAFANQKDLQAYLKRIEEAKKRDHRRLGKDLDLFSFHEEGPGFPFWHPKGTVLFNLVQNFLREECLNRGYHEVKTPQILSVELWHKSGHYDNYKENMYFTNIDEREFAVKPMNCPGGLLIYNTKLHSYRELPLKVLEFGLVHRHELSGVLHGLFRVRCFTQDDAHVFCKKEQAVGEIVKVINIIFDIYKAFGISNIRMYLSTRPEKSIGSDENWEFSTNALREALEFIGKDYELNEGDGAFYGPKIDFIIKDSLEREWQCGTCQIDLSMPELFDITYEATDGTKQRPVMLHRAILGSLERFIGILIEHLAGRFPVWLAPVQIIGLPLADRHNEYIQKLIDDMKAQGLRVEADFRTESLGYKIRNAQLEKIPYMIIAGDKEMDDNLIAVRHRDKGDLGQMNYSDFLSMVKKEIENKE